MLVTITMLHCLLVSITQCLSNWVEEIMERGIPSKSPYVDLEIQSHILASVIKRGDGSANLVQSSDQVLGLPLPQDSVQITVVQVEQRV